MGPFASLELPPPATELSVTPAGPSGPVSLEKSPAMALHRVHGLSPAGGWNPVEQGICWAVGDGPVLHQEGLLPSPAEVSKPHVLPEAPGRGTRLWSPVSIVAERRGPCPRPGSRPAWGLGMASPPLYATEPPAALLENAVLCNLPCLAASLLYPACVTAGFSMHGHPSQLPFSCTASDIVSKLRVKILRKPSVKPHLPPKAGCSERPSSLTAGTPPSGRLLASRTWPT